jgi:hypothetical protein
VKAVIRAGGLGTETFEQRDISVMRILRDNFLKSRLFNPLNKRVGQCYLCL